MWGVIFLFYNTVCAPRNCRSELSIANFYNTVCAPRNFPWGCYPPLAGAGVDFGPYFSTDRPSLKGLSNRKS
jgi:hypothetical protein